MFWLVWERSTLWNSHDDAAETSGTLAAWDFLFCSIIAVTVTVFSSTMRQRLGPVVIVMVWSHLKLICSFLFGFHDIPFPPCFVKPWFCQLGSASQPLWSIRDQWPSEVRASLCSQNSGIETACLDRGGLFSWKIKASVSKITLPWERYGHKKQSVLEMD